MPFVTTLFWIADFPVQPSKKQNSLYFCSHCAVCVKTPLLQYLLVHSRPFQEAEGISRLHIPGMQPPTPLAPLQAAALSVPSFALQSFNHLP